MKSILKSTPRKHEQAADDDMMELAPLEPEDEGKLLQLLIGYVTRLNLLKVLLKERDYQFSKTEKCSLI